MDSFRLVETLTGEFRAAEFEQRRYKRRLFHEKGYCNKGCTTGNRAVFAGDTGGLTPVRIRTDSVGSGYRRNGCWWD